MLARHLALGRSLLAVLTMLTVPALRAQQPDSILKAQLRNGMYAPPEARAILALLDDAEARGLPTDGLELRVRDGVAHNAAGQVTIRIVRDYLGALIEARNTLGSKASITELEYGATALSYHMPIGALRTIGSARSSIGSRLPLVIAVDLVRRGVPMESVGGDFVELVRAHASDAEFMGLLLRVGAARAQGSSILAAYQSGLDAIRSAHRLPQRRAPVPSGSRVG